MFVRRWHGITVGVCLRRIKTIERLVRFHSLVRQATITHVRQRLESLYIPSTPPRRRGPTSSALQGSAAREPIAGRQRGQPACRGAATIYPALPPEALRAGEQMGSGKDSMPPHRRTTLLDDGSPGSDAWIPKTPWHELRTVIGREGPVEAPVAAARPADAVTTRPARWQHLTHGCDDVEARTKLPWRRRGIWRGRRPMTRKTRPTTTTTTSSMPCRRSCGAPVL